MAWNQRASDNRTFSQQAANPSIAQRSAKISLLLLAACLTTGLGACAQVPSAKTMKNDLFDYLNLRNSFLNPSEVGRFDKANPFGQVRPVTWPILEQLDVVDETNDKWQTATDPVPSDLTVENREYVVGPGDTLRVTVFELVTPGLDYTKETQVNDVGALTLQNLGSIQVNGLTPSQIETKIAQVALQLAVLQPRSEHNFGPQVSVQLLQSRGRVFSILGVQRAGTYNIIGNDFRLLDALALAGDLQPQLGLDYLYVIRSTANSKYSSADSAPLTPADTGVPANIPVNPVIPNTPNPLDTIDTIEKPATAPDTAPQTAPATGPGAAAPKLVQPLPTAVELSNNSSPPSQLAQADLDAAISGSQPSSTPTAASITTPAATTSTAPGDDLLNQAMGAPTTANSGQYAFVDGKWVAVGNTATSSAPATLPGTPPMLIPPAATTSNTPPDTTISHVPSNEKALEDAEKFSGQRVIRIPISALREGHAQYNIVIHPGDTIVVPSVEQGFFYMAGHVNHPGVYALSGQKITLKMAVAAAGNLDALAIPRRCELVRRIGPNQEAIVQVNLQAIFDAEQPDIFLKANDVVNIGTDMVAPFLAVTRNAYRLSYGWGFVYDKNFAETSAEQSQGSGL